MLIATLLLVAQCADPSFCPTDDALRRAARKYRETAEVAFFLSLSEEERGGTTLTPWPAVIRVSGVACGAVLPGAQPSVLCRVTLHFRQGSAPTSYRLQRRDDIWSVAEEIGP